MSTVLIVDDNPDQLELRQMLLEAEGFSVLPAAAPAAAIEAFLAAPPDCVLMDLQLPSLQDGLALIRRLREAGPEVPIVVVSGAAEAFRAHPESVLVQSIFPKPSDHPRLVKALRALT